MRDRKNIAVLIGSSLAWREQVMRGIAGYANEQGNWHVFTAPEGEEYSVFFDGVGYRWDGLIIRPAGATFIRRALRLKVPVVSVGSLKLNVRVPRVKVNDRENMALVLRHLLAGGLRRFAYCSFVPKLAMEDRGPAFVAMVRDAGYVCECFNQSVQLRAKDTWQQRQRQLMGWLRRLPKPVGIATWGPDIACQVVDACNRLGIRVPEEVAVIAADDDAMKCELAQPTISAAEIPAARIGYEAAALLQRLMAGERTPEQPIEIAPTGVIAVRESTAVADRADRDVQQAAEVIHRSVGRPMSVTRLAEQMRVSTRWLQRHFKRVLGCTPRQRMRSERVAHAKRLLLETDWPASRVATAAGFHSPSHLNRVIRQDTGMPPLAFRKRFRL